MVLSWKTSTTIANVASQPLVGTVDVVEVGVAIAAVPEVGDAGEDVIKEVEGLLTLQHQVMLRATNWIFTLTPVVLERIGLQCSTRLNIARSLPFSVPKTRCRRC